MKNIEKDFFADQEWSICKKCGCLQLVKLIPLDLLYSSSHHETVVGNMWNQHHQEFANFILKDNPSSICEIGSAQGFLASIILNKIPNLNYCAIEPSATNLDPRIKHINGYVEDNLDILSQYSTIVHSHVIEHVYSVRNFIQQISISMNQTTTMYISFPNIRRILETNGANSLNFEHTYFLEPKQLNSLLNNFGLEVIENQSFLEHSFFMKVKKISSEKRGSSIIAIHDYAKFFDQMWESLQEFTENTIRHIDMNSTPIFLFGAHVFSQALHNLGLSKVGVIGVLDNSKSKIGKRLYGTPYEVFNPKIIANYSQVTVILKASHYQDEIREQLISLNPRVQILE